VDGITADPEIVQEGPSSSPSLALDGYTGTLERLLALAWAHQVDLARLSLPDLCDQLGAALARAGDAVPLSQQGAWLVMAAWLLQLRSRLLLPADASAMRAACADAWPSCGTCRRLRPGWTAGRSSGAMYSRAGGRSGSGRWAALSTRSTSSSSCGPAWRCSTPTCRPPERRRATAQRGVTSIPSRMPASGSAGC